MMLYIALFAEYHLKKRKYKILPFFQEKKMKILFTLLLMTLAFSVTGAEGKYVPYRIDGKPYEGYFVSPSPTAPLILLFHDWDGLTEYEVKRANMLAGEGYAVFVADLFGAGNRPTEDKDKRQHTGELYKDRKKMRALMIGAMDTAIELGANINNAIAMGYCFGGGAVLELARAGAPLKGFVTFHGGLTTPEGQDYSRTRGKVLVFHGEADTAISMNDFSQLESELQQHDVTHEMISYEGAPHAFTVFDSERYREDADRASWQRFMRFLDETLH